MPEPVRSCRNFGADDRESGQSRVPAPPAGITAQKLARSWQAQAWADSRYGDAVTTLRAKFSTRVLEERTTPASPW